MLESIIVLKKVTGKFLYNSERHSLGRKIFHRLNLVEDIMNVLRRVNSFLKKVFK